MGMAKSDEIAMSVVLVLNFSYLNDNKTCVLRPCAYFEYLRARPMVS